MLIQAARGAGAEQKVFVDKFHNVLCDLFSKSTRTHHSAASLLERQVPAVHQLEVISHSVACK
jgi:hypothetical protein